MSSTSLYIGASGLEAQSQAIDVVGDNIANVSTIGFKGSRATFEDIMGQQLLGGATESQSTGLGVQVGSVQKLMGQGSLENTGVNTDLAISGNGFFVVNSDQNGVSGNFYTRAGQFSVANNGTLVDPNGDELQGYGVNSAGVLQTTLGNLTVSGQTVPPKATANASIVANLDSGAAVTGPFSTANPSGTSNFSTSMTVYDSKGTAQNVNVYFSKTATNTYSWNAVVDGSQVTGGTAGTPDSVANGTLTFNTDGSLQATTGTAASVNFVGATPAQAIALNFGSTTGGGGTGLDGITQFAGTPSVSAQTQDGYASGSIQTVNIGTDGTVTGTFSNGQSRTVGQVALASFTNSAGLDRLGNSLFGATTQSGQALVGAANSGNRGAIESGTLEQSNVDLSDQFVDMIALERGYEANSKVVQTSDQMLQDVLQLKSAP